MSGLINTTARQYNVRCIAPNGNKTTVRIAPGFNVIDSAHWKHFVDGENIDPYIAELKSKGFIKFGPDMDDLEIEQAPDTKALSKSEPVAKLEAKLKQADKQAKADKQDIDKANAEAETAKLDARASLAKAKKAELELAELKKSVRSTNTVK